VWWGSVGGAQAWTGETNGAWGRKIRPAGGSVLRGAAWDSGEGEGCSDSGDTTRRGVRGAWL
jgi:hypothetical protein